MEVCPLEATDGASSVLVEERGFWEVDLWEMVVCKGGGRMTLRHYGTRGFGQSQREHRLAAEEVRSSGETGRSGTGRRVSRSSGLH